MGWVGVDFRGGPIGESAFWGHARMRFAASCRPNCLKLLIFVY